jgi:hypothetical protein
MLQLYEDKEGTDITLNKCHLIQTYGEVEMWLRSS